MNVLLILLLLESSLYWLYSGGAINFSLQLEQGAYGG
jgi:hypothetical protein